MKRKCEHCESEYECKRLTKKYCSDNCKQLAYFKRNGFQQAEKQVSPDKKNNSTAFVPDNKSIQETIINEIAEKVLELMRLREIEEKEKLKPAYCKPEAFSLITYKIK